MTDAARRAPRPAHRRRSRRLITSGSSFETDIGYSRTGFDYVLMAIATDIRDQAEQTLRNLDRALSDAGAEATDIVRVRYMFPDRTDFEPCWPILRRYFGAAGPAATMIVAGVSDPRMKIEIEVTARRRSSD